MNMSLEPTSIWRGGTPGDFELKAEVRMSAGNSGIQYRSKMLPPDGHAWRLGGYQMDLLENEFHRHPMPSRLCVVQDSKGQLTLVPDKIGEAQCSARP